ncbi:MAG: PDZ domain-containing protein [Pirellulaceae bacterium]|nr:PDZ domain-containing protein [Pirellulaceae bacterium]
MKPSSLAFYFVFAVVLGVAPQSTIAQSLSPTQQPQQEISELIQSLGSASFAERQKASLMLRERGEASVQPLTKAIASGDPETQNRAIAILGQLAIIGSPTSQKQAQDVLADLTRDEDRIVRQLALETINQMGEAMQNRALEQLREKGAEIKVNQNFGRFSRSNNFEIMIGPKFQGELDDFAMLPWLEGETKLTLIGEKINDAIIEKVAAMPSLYWLVIKRGTITNQSVDTLRDVKTLRYLHFYYVPIDDQSVESLVELKNLLQLRLFGTGVSREKGAWAQQAMASTDVDWRNGAFLGIYFNDTEGPCEVSDVVKDSAADKAGFRAGDRVVWFATKQIKTGKQFLGSVADFNPGDRVKCGVIRQGKELELELVLGRFPDVEKMK